MDRIEELLERLCRAECRIVQHILIEGWENLGLVEARDTLEKKIADEYRAMVEALEQAGQTLTNLGNGFLPADTKAIAYNEAANLRDTLARVKGE